MLRALMDKADSMKQHIDNVSREMDILRKNKKEKLEIKNTGTEMKNAFDELSNRLDTAEKRTSVLEDISIETSKTEEPHPPEGRQQKQEELQFCGLWKENHIHRKIDKMKRQRTLYQMKEQDKTP